MSFVLRSAAVGAAIIIIGMAAINAASKAHQHQDCVSLTDGYMPQQ